MFENEFTWGNAIANNTTDVFHEQFEKAVGQVKNNLNKEYPLIINGKEIFSKIQFEVKSAKDAFFEWSNTPYQTRAKIFKECADLFSKQKFRLSAIMSFENGKTRIEAMGDVDEAIDFMRFYAYQLEINKGFSKETEHPNPKEKTRTILKPYGVWGIIAPFNFPSAIAIGMTTGALITGNTTVLKPASDTPLSSFEFVNAIYKKLPSGAINFVT